MNFNADTITDEQIRELREREARWLDANPASAIGDRIRYDDWVGHNSAFLAAEKALGNRRSPRGGKRAARARCAAILNRRCSKCGALCDHDYWDGVHCPWCPR